MAMASVDPKKTIKMKTPKITKKRLLTGKAFNVVEYTATVDGVILKRDIIEQKHGVVAVPVHKDHTVLLLSEYCAGSNSFVISLPGGKAVGKTRADFAREAQRELREETGFRARRMTKLRFSYSPPSTSNRRSYVFLAYDLVHDPLPETDEIIQVIRLPLDEAIKRCYRDFVSDVSTIGNLLMARDKLQELAL